MRYPILNKFIFIFLIMFILSSGYGQKANKTSPKPFIEGLPFTSVTIDSNTPLWAKMLYEENPNIYEVQKLYEEWRKSNPTIKNGHTRNFKHYYNYLVANDGIRQDGFIKSNLAVEIYNNKKNWELQRQALIEKNKSNSSNRSTNNTDWVSLGPDIMYQNGNKSNIQANIYAISQSASNPDIIYATSEAGGTLFRSNDKGENWFSTSDDISFGGNREIEVDPFNPDIVYLGSSHDIYKTLDGGTTWNSVYYNWNTNPNAIIIDPSNSSKIVVSSSERILRSTDAGSTWTEVYTGRTYDVKYKPGNSNIVYALMDNSTTFQTDFYRSTDGGVNWTQITNGWPNETSTSNKGGRMTVSDNNPDIIYAFIGANWADAPSSKDGIKVVKSIDAGLSWTTVLNYDDAGGVDAGQGYYDWDIEVSDNDPDIVLLGTQGRWLTTDGFATTNWAKSGGQLGHADLQEALFNGSDLWVANDGGIIKFTDETFSNFDIKAEGINAVSFWSFDQGWNRDAQVGSHYHNGTSARTDSYTTGQYLNYGGAEPQFSALKHPNPDKAWSKGYGAVNGKNLPDNIEDPIINFNYNITPNAEYGSATWRESEIEVLPYAYNTHFTGSDNVLYRSDDFGLSWDTIAVFGDAESKVTKIEIPRSNPDVMYVAVYDSDGYSLHRSDNLGETFNTITGPEGISDDGVYISVDQNDENILYFSTSNGGIENNKVYKTIDGGVNWTNLSTDALDNHSPRSILSISGTDGGVYVIAANAVFYRNNTLPDWETLITNLPSSAALRDIKPYYKEGKIRVAGDARGVWGAELFDSPSVVIPQPSVNLVNQPCSRDTLFFDDFSIVNHDNASWLWEFSPTPLFVDNLNVRNPKVVFGTSGTFNATMHLTVDGVTYSKTLQKDIVLTNGCDADKISGNSYDISAYGNHSTISGINKTLDAFTYSMWVRPRESQVSTAFMVSKSGDNAGINYYGSTKQVTIHYPGYSTWSYQTGLLAPAERWTHLALTSDINTGDIILYVNGEPYNYTDANGNYIAKTIEFDIIKLGWQHNWWGSRWFNGEIDEFCLYQKALTQDEIRLQMHHTKVPLNDPDLLHYYQFNEESGGLTYDKVDLAHAETPSIRVKSRGPIGDGSTDKMDITTDGIYNFNNQGVILDFKPGTLPNGEISVSRILGHPDENPNDWPSSSSYWVIHNYGENASFTGLNSIEFNQIGNTSSAYNANDLNLFKRETNQDSTNWIAVDGGDILNNETETITFNTGLTITDFSQYVIANKNAKGWIGVESTDWDNPLNWGDGIIPDANSNVIIPANTPFQPIVNVNATIKSLIMMKDAEIRINTGIVFQINE